MTIDIPDKYESWLGFLSVYVIVRSNGNNVVYKLHYFFGVVRHQGSNITGMFMGGMQLEADNKVTEDIPKGGIELGHY